jgi:hypothetical protein
MSSDTSREQLSAAWQLHVDRIGAELERGWRELARRSQESEDRARRGAAEGFNRAVRRLSRFDTREEWAAAVFDSSAPYAPRTALFAVAGETLKPLKGVTSPEIVLSCAPAFGSAAASAETVAALRTAGELSRTIADALGPAAGERCWLFPIAARGRAAAILYAEGPDPDINGLEALAALAGAALQLRASAAPDLAEVPPQEQGVHLRAQRFARVRVAEMQLYKAQAVRLGRAQKNLYAQLKPEIDSAREAYEQFMTGSPSMADYLHMELTRTLANDDAALLGEHYPGPLL